MPQRMQGSAAFEHWCASGGPGAAYPVYTFHLSMSSTPVEIDFLGVLESSAPSGPR